jgi:hypothetical protein
VRRNSTKVFCRQRPEGYQIQRAGVRSGSVSAASGGTAAGALAGNEPLAPGGGAAAAARAPPSASALPVPTESLMKARRCM